MNKENTKGITVRLPNKILDEIDKLILKGFYSNRSEYIREKIRIAITEKLPL